MSAARCLVLSITACGWPEGLPSDSSVGESPTSTDASSTTTSSDADSSSTTTTNGAGTTTTGVDTTTEDEGVDFIMGPDGGHKNLECDIWENDCPRGEKCMPWVNDGGSSWNATKCVPIARDPAAPGEPCTVVGNGVRGVDDCDEGSMCWNVDPETNMGECIAFCIGPEANPICEDPYASCTIAGDGVLILCIPHCDPLLQDCGGTQGCYPTREGFHCVWDGSEDTGAHGDACEYVNACDPGLFCANAASVPDCDAASCCTPFCDLGNALMCPLFTECMPWYEDDQAPPGLENVGVCTVAA